MDEHDLLAERFEAHRAHLRAVAYRLLGSRSEADDAVQESWLRLSRTDTSGVDNLGGWLTTVVARVCLDRLRWRTAKREEAFESAPELTLVRDDTLAPEDEALLADSVGLALLVVLETLAPAERVAFVLHDLFAVPFDEIAAIVGRSEVAARQLASRARRRVQGAAVPDADADLSRQREIVDALLAAARGGDFETLVALLDPDVVLRSDAAAVKAGAEQEVRGAPAVAGQFSGRAQVARPALVDGVMGIVWAPGGRPRVVFDLTITGQRIAGIDVVADPERLGELDVVLLDD
jgi:RNA polymerase sigma factor (sigma-70 family)